MVHNTRRSVDCVCGKSYVNKSGLHNHQKKCEVYLSQAIEGVDYVKCKICGFTGKSISAHVKRNHSLSKSEYEKKYGPTVCESTKSTYSETSKINGDWIKRAKERGEDLTGYFEKLSNKISEGIMKSDSAREARRQNLSGLNRTQDFRERSSKTAKKTSSRKDIQDKRSKRLARWRENNPEEFYKKCTSVMHKSWQSKPETDLFGVVDQFFPDTFKRNQILKRTGKFLSTKTNIRQIDIMSLENKIVIEFDGIHHFKDVFKKKGNLNEVSKKDQELNSVLVEEGWTVIRVSYDEYDYKENNGAVIAQLWHCGGFRKLGMDPDPLVPGHTASGIVRPGKKVAHAMTVNDIKETIEAYASDAKICEEIGFDGVEIHGAHGYLIDNFFWSGTNKRNDSYGGSIKNRSKLATDIVKAIRSNVSNQFIVGLRFSQWKQQDYEAKLANSPNELKELINDPIEEGLDFLHSSMRRFWESEFEGSDENLAYWTKKLSGLPTISVGSVGLDSDFIDMSAPASPTNINKAIDDINQKKYDLVAVGRALLADHEWVVKIKEGRVDDIVPYSKEALLKLY